VGEKRQARQKTFASAPGDGERTARDAALEKALGEYLFSRLVIPLATTLKRLAALEYKAQYGLSHVDWTILALIGDAGQISFKDLSRLIALDAGQLSRGLKSLAQRELVQRTNQRTFPREQILSLTQDGAVLFTRMRRTARARNRKLLEDIPLEDLRRFADLVETTHARALAMLQEARPEAKGDGKA
jgi:DNA-binding MarR family transcriptional regulator